MKELTEHEGPKIKLTCDGCKHKKHEFYNVQGDSGCNHYCMFKGEKKYIYDTSGLQECPTPDWCPLLSKDQPVVGAEEYKIMKVTRIGHDEVRLINNNGDTFTYNPQKRNGEELEDFLSGADFHASQVALKLARGKIGEYKNPYDQKKQYVEWAAVENALDDLLRNELKNKLI